MSRNERKTEDIVRSHFKKYSEMITIEEQSSDTPKIKKLLSRASKSGVGRGSPEFIIQYKDNPDFLIIVECKADITKHESKDHAQYKDYAVDGVLLYSSYLAKEFDVLSIAVSGESESEIKISHFLQLKGATKGVTKFSNKFLPPDDYLEGYLKSPEKFRQDYEELLTFSKNLNTKLHGYKIPEGNRALLISCILIALESPAFRKSYKEYSKAEDLAKSLVEVAEMQLKNSGIQDKKLSIVKGNFEFIKFDASLSQENHVLREIISEINENINSFMRTYEYFDVLGQLYIEFLRYANSDKGLGIVLTPPHITQFMASLGEVNRNSVVYDNCTGTGGFLVSAMNLMIKDAKEDRAKIKDIRQKQLFGVEYQPHIFALACSNMFIHQDGKTNILNGNCFDEEIIKKIQEKSPTVGLLNPPYKADKKGDIEELEFVLNNLECIEQGGKTIAIVPMQSALANSGKIFELKKKLLEEHTLEAVFSMPNELFINSKVGAVTCIMVFTAKRPHPAGKKTFFGYFKEDGFVKRKNKGRIDAFDHWNAIQENWIDAYMNKEDVVNPSVSRVVNAEDEWCVEAYMELDYELLTLANFNKAIRKFLAFKIVTQEEMDLSKEPVLRKQLNLDFQKWQVFTLDKIFEDISLGRPVHKDQINIENKGSIAYVTRTTENNGVEMFLNNTDEYPQNKSSCITIGAEGFEAFYQINNFVTGNKINIFRDKNLNIYNALFIKPILDLEVSKKFNYGRGATKERLAVLEIKLPARNNQPDWQAMESYIKSLPYSRSL